eukprot:gene19702-27890_t
MTLSAGTSSNSGWRRRRSTASISSPAATAAASATRMLSLSGKANAAIAAVAATPVASRVATDLQRKGYAGERRRILVVDNEEPDRELLVQLLEPLGFELRQAASGHDALDLLATGYRPHVIFMDLAMPGIDGWETLRRVRQMRLPDVQCAIVSANAFDKALDNDVEISPEDFIVKDRMSRRLTGARNCALPTFDVEEFRTDP